MLNDKTAKLIERLETYPNGANSPTCISRYECACGEGRIEYVTVPGFGDYYTEILCPTCAKKYDTRMGCGYLWELIERK